MIHYVEYEKQANEQTNKKKPGLIGTGKGLMVDRGVRHGRMAEKGEGELKEECIQLRRTIHFNIDGSSLHL